MTYRFLYGMPFGMLRAGGPATPAARRAISMTPDAALLDEARSLGVNLSHAAKEGLLATVKAERQRRWAQENAEFIRDYHQ